MRVIPPIAFTEAMLTSSTAAEPGTGETAYSTATTYVSGQRAILGSPASTVTITIAAPGVISWAANGLPNGTPVVLTTTGALPTGFTAGVVYFIVNRTADQFQLAETADGTPITTTGSQSGTHTATAQLHRQYESLSGSAATVTMTIASPCVVTQTAHGLSAGTPIVFSTTGALPTGLTAGTYYYVLAPTNNTFNVAATVGGTAINTSGSQSGTHTCTANPNIAHLPAIDDGTWWQDVGPTNRWAMFDLLRNTGTSGASPLTVVVTPGQRFDAIGLVGLVADSVTATVTVGGSPVWTETVDLSTREVLDWYDYFFAAFSFASSAVFFDVPPYSTAVLTITATRSSGLAKIGGLVLGAAVYIGLTQYEAESDALNFSIITRDDYGNSVLVPRRTVPKSVQRIMADKENVNRIRQLREQLNAVPALWSGLDDDTDGYFDALLILGIYTRFTISLDHPDNAIISLDLEEV